jgi:NAD(P)-dependent dehydrogenase (short-subunit alcohol dehydrogenase family)
MSTDNKKWALIVGGGSGLGLASALKLAKDGHHIAIVHRTRRELLPAFEDCVAQMRLAGAEVSVYHKDALKPETIEEVVGGLPQKGVRLLLHSIAKGSLRSLTGDQESALGARDLSITLHAMGYNWYEWGAALYQNDRFAEDARNLAFTSEGNQKVWPGYGAVSSAKAVLEALMRQMAIEWAPLGIRTNCIQAGVTQTDSFKMIPGSQQLASLATKRNPFNRLTTPVDVANAVSLLASEKANWINGSIIKVDGGEHLR